MKLSEILEQSDRNENNKDLAKEKEAIAREREALAKEKEQLSNERERLALQQDKEKIAREKEELEKEKEELDSGSSQKPKRFVDKETKEIYYQDGGDWMVKKSEKDENPKKVKDKNVIDQLNAKIKD